MIKCDVLVVGGGPAGISVSDAASSSDLDVVCIDKNEKIGEPVKCAEGIGEYLLEKLPFNFPDELLEWKIDGLKFVVNGEEYVKEGAEWAGYSISRDKVDSWLASRAKNNGAQIMKETEFKRLERRENKNVSLVETRNGTMEIESRYVVGADGVVSDIAKSLGIEPERKPGYVYSWEARGLDIDSPQYEYLFLDEFSPHGYGYMFPKSENVANIGVGDLFTREGIEQKFEEFMRSSYMENCLEDAELVTEKSGQAPFRDRHTIADGNIYFVGDSANQNIKPFIEGFLPSVICGWIVGKNIEDLDRKSYRRLVKKKLPELYESKKLEDPMIKVFKEKGAQKFHKLLELMTSEV